MLWTYNGLHPIFIYIPSKCKCFSPFGNLILCSPLILYLCSFNYLSYGNVICGTSCLYSFSCFSYKDFIYGIFVVCLTICTIVGIVHTTIGTIDGSTLPLIKIRALTFVLSYSLFTLKHEAPSSSILFLLLKALIGKFVATFFLFYDVVCNSSLIF
jgi:hypothetical protein